jgi:hypothetical protein
MFGSQVTCFAITPLTHNPKCQAAFLRPKNFISSFLVSLEHPFAPAVFGFNGILIKSGDFRTSAELLDAAALARTIVVSVDGSRLSALS